MIALWNNPILRTHQKIKMQKGFWSLLIACSLPLLYYIVALVLKLPVDLTSIFVSGILPFVVGLVASTAVQNAVSDDVTSGLMTLNQMTPLKRTDLTLGYTLGPLLGALLSTLLLLATLQLQKNRLALADFVISLNVLLLCLNVGFIGALSGLYGKKQKLNFAGFTFVALLITRTLPGDITRVFNPLGFLESFSAFNLENSITIPKALLTGSFYFQQINLPLLSLVVMATGSWTLFRLVTDKFAERPNPTWRPWHPAITLFSLVGIVATGVDLHRTVNNDVMSYYVIMVGLFLVLLTINDRFSQLAFKVANKKMELILHSQIPFCFYVFCILLFTLFVQYAALERVNLFIIIPSITSLFLTIMGIGVLYETIRLNSKYNKFTHFLLALLGLQILPFGIAYFLCTFVLKSQVPEGIYYLVSTFFAPVGIYLLQFPFWQVMAAMLIHGLLFCWGVFHLVKRWTVLDPRSEVW